MITIAGFVLAAALGTLGRGLLLRRFNATGPLPWGTLAVNVTGSFALGLAAGLDIVWLTVLGVGGLGAYTTFSSFAVEMVQLHEQRRDRLTVAYLTLMVVSCVAAAWAGLALS